MRRTALVGVDEGTDADTEARSRASGKGKGKDRALPQRSSLDQRPFSFIVEDDALEYSNFPYDLSGGQTSPEIGVKQVTKHARGGGETHVEGRRVLVVERPEGPAGRGRQPAPPSEEYESSSSLARRLSKGRAKNQEANGATRRKRSLSFGRRKSGRKTREEAPALPGAVSADDPTFFPPHPAVSPPRRSPSIGSGMSSPRSPYTSTNSRGATSSSTSLSRTRSVTRLPAEAIPPLPSLTIPSYIPRTNSDLSTTSSGEPSLTSSNLSVSSYGLSNISSECPSRLALSLPLPSSSSSSQHLTSLSASRSASFSLSAPGLPDPSPSQPRSSASERGHWSQRHNDDMQADEHGHRLLPQADMLAPRGQRASAVDVWDALGNGSYSRPKSAVQIRVDIAPPEALVPVGHPDARGSTSILSSLSVPSTGRPRAASRQDSETSGDALRPSLQRRMTLVDQRAASRVSMAEQRVLDDEPELKPAPRRLRRKHAPTASIQSLKRAETASEPEIVRRASAKSKKGKEETSPGYHSIQAGGNEKPRRPSFLSRISDFARGKKSKAPTSMQEPDVGVRPNEELFVDEKAALAGRMSLGEGYACSEPGHGQAYSWSIKSRSEVGHGFQDEGGDEIDVIARRAVGPGSLADKKSKVWGTDIGHDACVASASGGTLEDEYRKLTEDRKWTDGFKGKAQAAKSVETLRAKSVETMRASSTNASGSMHTRSSDTMRTDSSVARVPPTREMSRSPADGAGERLPAYEEALEDSSSSRSSPVAVVTSLRPSEGSVTPRSIESPTSATTARPPPTPLAIPRLQGVRTSSGLGTVDLNDEPASAMTASSDHSHSHHSHSDLRSRSSADFGSWRAPSALLDSMLDYSVSPEQSRAASRTSLADAQRESLALSPLPPSPSSSRMSKYGSIGRASATSATPSTSSSGRTPNKLVKKSRRTSTQLLETFVVPRRSSTEPTIVAEHSRSPTVWLNTPPSEHKPTFGGALFADRVTSQDHSGFASAFPVLVESPRSMEPPTLAVSDCQYCSPRDERDDAFISQHVPDSPELRTQPSRSDVTSTRAMRRWTVSGLEQQHNPDGDSSDESEWGQSDHEDEVESAKWLAVAANKPLPSSSLLPPSPSMPSLAYFGHAAERQGYSYFGVKDKTLPPTPAQSPGTRQQRATSMRAPQRPQLRPLSVMSPVPALHEQQSLSSPPTRTVFEGEASTLGRPKIFEVSAVVSDDESSSDERDDHVFDQYDEPGSATPGTSAGTSSLGHGQWEGITRSASKSKTYSHLRTMALPADAAHMHLLHITAELLATEKHFVSLLRLLLIPGSTRTSPPPLMRTYVQELVNVCDGLVRSMEGRSDLMDGAKHGELDGEETDVRRRGGEHKRPAPPSPAATCHAIIALRDDVEGAYVRWCGVVGGWFVGPSENGGASIGRAKRRLSKGVLGDGSKRSQTLEADAEEQKAAEQQATERKEAERKETITDAPEQQHAPEQGEETQEGVNDNTSAESSGERPPLPSQKSTGRRSHVWRKSVPSLATLQMQIMSSSKKEEDGTEGQEASSAKPKESGSVRALSKRERKERQRKLPTVRELAILPTQRVMRYVLLYRDLLAHTPQTSPIRPLVQSAVDVAASIAAKCDRAQGNAEFFHRAR